MALALTQISIDVLNYTASVSLGGQVNETQYASISLLVPIPRDPANSATNLETSARAEAIKHLRAAIELLDQPKRSNDIFG